MAFALLVLLVLARDSLFSFLEHVFGLSFANIPIVETATLPGRIVIAGVYVAALALLIAGSFLLPERWRFAVLALVSLAGTAIALRVMGGSVRPSILIAGLFAANAAPEALLLRLFKRRGLGSVFDGLFGLGLLVSEIFLPRPFWLWLRSKRWTQPLAAGKSPLAFVPALVVAGVLMALIAPYPATARLTVAMARNPAVDRFYGDGFKLYSAGDVAAMALDPATGRLFLCGNGLKTVRVVALANLHAAPRDTGIPSRGSQFCYADTIRREFVVAQEDADTLLVADLDSYAIKRRIGPLDFGDGETFVSKQPGSPVAAIASEDVGRDATKPRVRLIDTASGQMLARSQLRPGYLFVHPTRPIVYVSSYSDGFGIVALNLGDLSLRQHQPGDTRLDRVTLDPTRDEILVASPLHSRVLAYDAVTLAPRGAIATQFGVRSVAVDPTRDLLLTASLISRHVDVIDLKSRNRLASYAVGPWMRDIVIDARCGRAFVSSRTGVYAVQYATPAHASGDCGPGAAKG